MESIYCDVAYTTLKPAGSISSTFGDPSTFPPEDWMFSTENRMWLDLVSSRARLEIVGEVIHGDLKRIIPRNETRMFNGDSFQKFTPKQGYPSQRDAKVRTELQEFGKSFPQFLDHGILALLNAIAMLPSREAKRVRELPSTRLDGGQFRLVRGDDGEVVLRTVNLVTGGRESFFELWVDLTRDAAITRYVGHRQGRQYKTIDYQYEGTRFPVWIPTGGTETRYRPDGEL